MKNRIRTWAAPAKRTASLLIAMLLAASMLFYGAPFALVGGVLQGSAPSVGTAAAEELGQQTLWTDQIDTMLGSSEYVEGEVVAIVAPAARASGAQAASVAGEEGSDQGAGSQGSQDLLLDCADTEELALTTGDAYESAFDEALPEAAIEGTQIAMAAEAGSAELPAVQSSDVELYTLLVKQEGMTTEQILRELANDQRVVWAEPNYTGSLSDGDSAAANDANKEAVASSVASATASGNGNSEVATAGESGSGDANGDANGNTDGDPAGESGTGGADGDNDGNAGSEKIDGVTPGDSAVVASDKLTDGTSLQWGYADSDTSAYGSLHKEGFDVNLDSWNTDKTNSAGVIAIVDTGVDYTNPDLADVMFDMSSYISQVGGDKYGFNSTGDGGDSGDVFGHGTHCAGIAAAAWNGYGVSGAANGAKLLSVRSGNNQGRFTNDAEVKGFAYLERAVDAGVDIRVVSNSWGVEGIANRALYLAAESLGAKGVAVVFASGNDNLNVDKGLDTAKIQGASDYVTVVNSSMMTGIASSFTNYGKTTTDVFAPGTSILSTANSKGNANTSTFIPSLIKDKNSLAAYSDFSEGSTEIEAWTGIFQVSGGKAAESKVGEVDTGTVGFDSANGVLKISKSALEEANAESPDMNIVLSLKVPVDGSNLSKLSEVAASVALDGGAANDALGLTALMLESVDSAGKTSVVGAYSGIGNLQAGWNQLSNSTQKALIEAPGSQLAVHTDAKGNKYIWLNLLVMVDSLKKSSAEGLLIDCVGAGNELTPYQYQNGTSMATPCVAGLAAVASEQMEGYSSLDKSVRAAALTRVLKGSVTQYDSLSGLCSSNGMIDASKFSATGEESRVPTVVSATLSSDEETIAIKGDSFGAQEGSVTIGGKGAAVKSWSENEVVVERPAGLISGYLEVVLTRADGKSCSYGQTFAFTKHVSEDDVPVYEQVIDTPDFLDGCAELNTLTAFDGSLYVFGARELSSEELDPNNAQSEALRYEKVWRYEIASGTWSEAASLPCRLANVSCTLWNGKMLVMGSAASDNYGGLATKKLFSYDPSTAQWSDLSDKVASDDVPYQASIVNVGDRLLLVGGSVVSKLPEDTDAAEKQGVWVSSKYSYENAKILVGGDTTLMTLASNNVREFDFDTGKATVVGSCSPRSNTGLSRSFSDIQTALCGNKLYVFGGAKSDVSSVKRMDEGAYSMECLTLNSDGSVTCESLGSYAGKSDSPKGSGALPAVLSGYELGSGFAATADGPVLASVLATSYDKEGNPTSELIQDDTFLLNSDGTEFESIGKRVNSTPTVYSRAIAYRGMLYVLGHDYSNSYETVMRATAIATNELPGDVVRGGGSGGVVPGGEPADAPASGEKAVLAKTGDATAPVAAVALVLTVGCAAVVARRACRRGAVRK